jgi:tRNA pseudouridine38-40 synthase
VLKIVKGHLMGYFIAVYKVLLLDVALYYNSHICCNFQCLIRINSIKQMARYFIEMSFKGTNYHGWQNQPNAITVQAEIEKALATLTREDIKTTGAGRTDTGVHAQFFVAHFDTTSHLLDNKSDYLYKINALLPQDIAIYNIYPVKPDAHARYSAISRTYKYTIRQVKDPFGLDFSWYYSGTLNIAAMNKAANKLMDYSDFTSFSKLHSDVKTNNCQILEAIWSTDGDHLIFTIRSNRFLRNMVRSIVGTMIDIGRGKLNMDDLTRILDGRNRNLAGFSAPAQGLAHVHVQYPEDIEI